MGIAIPRQSVAEALQRYDPRDDERAVGSEDDFDSLFPAAALLRCLLENVPLAGGSVDARAEGGIVGTEAIVF